MTALMSRQLLYSPGNERWHGLVALASLWHGYGNPCSLHQADVLAF